MGIQLNPQSKDVAVKRTAGRNEDAPAATAGCQRERDTLHQ
jgi:hypothetical protein